MPPLSKPERAAARGPARAALVLAVVAAVTVVAWLALSRDEERSEAAADDGEFLSVLRDVVAPLPDIGLSREEPPGPRGPRYPLVRIRAGEEIELREAPGGEMIRDVGAKTEFGLPRSLWVERIHGDWLGVPVPELPNGELGWIRDDRSKLEVYETAYSLRADLSQRLVQVRYGSRLLATIPVSVGRPGSETPPGNYAVTDALAGDELGPYYGCCVLAISGHQPSLPADWIGGDRIAIHGTPGPVGEAASLGCLRATNSDMVSLFARVPLGTPVFIRA